MQESWRNILERAASNLSIELDPNVGPALQHQAHGWRAAPRTSQRPRSSSERCDLLARELEALCRPERRPQLPQMRAHPGRYPAALQQAQSTQLVCLPAASTARTPKKSGAARELAALSVSVAVVVLAIYGFLFLLK